MPLHGLAAAVCLATPLVASSEGIPEPDLVMYGQIVNISGNPYVRVGYGTLTWEFQPVGGGPPIIASTTLTNINNRFSYIMRIPCETPVFGFPSSSNTIPLTSAGVTFNRAYVSWNNTNLLSFAQPALTNTTFFSADRGRIERVDLNVTSPLLIDPYNGLPVDWELTYFGRLMIDPSADPDHDGLSNFAEYRAGTDPTDPLSGLWITEIAPVTNGIQLKWTSEDFRFYALQRSSTASGTFLDIQTNIAATAPTNLFVDVTAIGNAPYFYRLRLDDAYAVPTILAMPPMFTEIQNLGTAGIRIGWSSIANQVYTLQRTSDPAHGFALVATNLVATPPANSYLDTSATGRGPYFYRLQLGP